ncbi:MAG TPA: nicotinate-nucleotide adenylyltransferase [Vicinamibacterales bacterium]|jgi:nicotinate-nucleotide adenylyltransferase|nr:nicotinate-nucleotide adenylyltransferase [Vicinamibacterales bacterium]
MTARRIGILGGTFDPIHCGHVDLARAAEEALGLTRVFIVTSNVPPHRATPAVSSYHRFAMVALAVAGRPRWCASDIELKSAEASYTSTTLRRFHADGYSPDELFFLTGADAFAEVETWRDYPAILDLAQFVVVSRPGFPVGELRRRLPSLVDRAILIDAPTADVSSTSIRRRIAARESIAGLVPPGVRQHIDQHGLYATMSGRLHGED